jgi:hypothetical protein
MPELPERLKRFLNSDHSEKLDGLLGELLRVRGSLSELYEALSRNPERTGEALELLTELWSSYNHLAQLITNASRSSAPPYAQSNANVLARGDAATDETIRRWAIQFATRAPAIEPSPFVAVCAQLDCLGPPPGAHDEATVARELVRMEEAVMAQALRQVSTWPPDLQRRYLRHIVARINAIRDTPYVDTAKRSRINSILGDLRDYARSNRPGTVYGLSNSHTPQNGSWIHDAQDGWRAIRGSDEAGRPATPERLVTRGSGPKEPLKRPRPEREPAQAQDDAVIAGSDQRVLMVGGSPREISRARIQRILAIQELDWISDEPRKIDSAESSILQHGYDLVLMLIRFVSHVTSERFASACARTGVPCVAVDHGYGIGAIKRALAQRVSRPINREMR